MPPARPRNTGGGGGESKSSAGNSGNGSHPAHNPQRQNTPHENNAGSGSTRQYPANDTSSTGEATARRGGAASQNEDSRSDGSGPVSTAQHAGGKGSRRGGASNAAGSGNVAAGGSSGGGGGGGGGASGNGGGNGGNGDSRGAATGGAVNSNGSHAHEGIEGIDWSTVPLSFLHKYRHAYRLRVPSASPFWNHLILNQGIGKRTPARAGYTLGAGGVAGGNGVMAPGTELLQGGGGSGGRGGTAGMGWSGRGRVTREQLATVVRKNFNAQPINESDVIVNFLYSVKNQGKQFRLRFPPR